MTSTCLFALQTTTGHPLDVILPDLDWEICKLVCGAVWQCWRHRYRGYFSARPSSSFLSFVVDMSLRPLCQAQFMESRGNPGFPLMLHVWRLGWQSTWTFFSKWQKLQLPHFMALREVKLYFFANIKILVFELKLFVQVESLNFDLVGFQKCTVFLPLVKQNF